MLRGFPGLSDYFVMPPIEARALGIGELHGKPNDPNSLISLVGTGHGFVDASMSGCGVCERHCSEHTAAVIGRQSERWRWDVEEAIRAREHALKPHDVVAFDGAMTFSEVPPSIITSEDWHEAF